MIFDEQTLDTYLSSNTEDDENDIYKYNYSMYFTSNSPNDSKLRLKKY